MKHRRTGYVRGAWKIETFPDDSESVRRVCARLERDVADGRRMPPSEVVLARLLDSARRDDGLPTEGQITALQIQAQQCGLTREDRLELATVLLGRDVESWSSFTAGEVRRMFDAIAGFAFVAHLQAEQGRRWRYAKCPAADDCPMLHGGS